MNLYGVEFMNGRRKAYTAARSIPEAVAKIKKALKDSVYVPEEQEINAVSVMGRENWPGVFGG